MNGFLLLKKIPTNITFKFLGGFDWGRDHFPSHNLLEIFTNSGNLNRISQTGHRGWCLKGPWPRQMPQGGKGPTQCRKRKASGVFVIFVPFISVWSEQQGTRRLVTKGFKLIRIGKQAHLTKAGMAEMGKFSEGKSIQKNMQLYHSPSEGKVGIDAGHRWPITWVSGQVPGIEYFQIKLLAYCTGA